MICSTCSSTVSAGDVFCGACGARQQPAAAPSQSVTLDPQAVERVKEGAQAAARLAQDFSAQVGTSSVFKGLLTLFTAFFTMPFKTMSVAGRLLREIGEKGALDKKTDHPHLTWLTTALSVLATTIFFLVLIFGTLGVFGAGSLLGKFGGGSSIFLKIGSLVGVYLTAVVIDWAIMFFGELLALNVYMSQYMRAQLAVMREQSANVSVIAAAARGAGQP